MTKKFPAILCCLIFITGFAFCTDYEECFKLNVYFGQDYDIIHNKIDEYRNKILNEPDDYYADLAVGILYGALSSPNKNPEKGASEKILEYTEKFLKKDPTNSLGLIYNALGYSLAVRDSSNSFVQFLKVNTSSGIFDRAVKLSKGAGMEWYAHYMRANYFANLPGFFNKSKIAEEDYGFVESYYMNNPDIEGYMIVAYYYLGNMEKNKGNIENAVNYWKKSVELQGKLGTNLPEGKSAAENLENYKG